MEKLAPTIALFAKYPRWGEVKTRLIPAIGKEGAAALHRHLVERTITAMRESGLGFTLYSSGAEPSEFADWLGDDFPIIDQGSGDLGARLARVPAPCILLGADIPELTSKHLRDCAEALRDGPVVIGPASDGGYYLLGLREPAPFLFAQMPWGTGEVRAETQARLQARHLDFRLLDELDDCDRPEDLAKWPQLLEGLPK